MGPRAALVIALVGALSSGCGKSRLVDVEPWDAPSRENGFHPADQDCRLPGHCVRAPEPIPRYLRARPREAPELVVALDHPGAGLAVDAVAVYHGDDVGGGGVFGAARERRGAFRVASLAGAARDVAVDATHLYVSMRGEGPLAGRSGVAILPRGLGTAAVAFRGDRGLVFVEAAEPPRRLVADGAGVTWISEGGIVRHASPSGAVTDVARGAVGGTRVDRCAFAASGGVTYYLDGGAIFEARAGAPPRLFASARGEGASIVDVAVDGAYVYWIERDAFGAQSCGASGDPVFAPRGRRTGELRRAPVSGGEPEVFAADLVEPLRMSVRDGVAWVATSDGVVRADAERASLYPTATVIGRPAVGPDGAVFFQVGRGPREYEIHRFAIAP